MKVSVLIKAYNHERFIADAVESVLEQRVGCDYEIVIGEDCSTDGTRAVLLSLRDKYPDHVRLLLRDRNLGNIRNFTDALRACRGEYVALLDGDDYWISPLKLRHQIAFLDAHREFSSCAHHAVVVDESARSFLGTYHRQGRSHVITLRRMLMSDPVPTSSVMFRRGLFAEFPDWYYTVMMGDWPLHVLNLAHGNMWYESAVLAAHRVHPSGLWSGADPVRRRTARIEIYWRLNEELGLAHDALIRARIARQYVALAEHYAENGDIIRARECVRHAVRAYRWAPRLLLRRSFLKLLPDVFRQSRRISGSAGLLL